MIESQGWNFCFTESSFIICNIKVSNSIELTSTMASNRKYFGFQVTSGKKTVRLQTCNINPLYSNGLFVSVLFSLFFVSIFAILD